MRQPESATRCRSPVESRPPKVRASSVRTLAALDDAALGRLSNLALDYLFENAGGVS